MFDWFWSFLYSISQILFEVIDGILAICNKVCGVEPIQIAGREVSFINTLLVSDNVRMGFIIVALVGIFLLMIFSTIAICRNMREGKKSTSEIIVQVFKTLFIFLLVPALMIGFSSLINVLVQVVFTATRGGSQSVGDFLFKSFTPVGMKQVDTMVDWRDVSSVKLYLSKAGYSLSDYRFFFSWLVCLPLLWFIARSLFMFIDRTLSIIILFIFSPVSLSTVVLDDGARFKIWRDKILSKFISGFGMIIAVNIYILVLSFVTRSDVVFFPGTNPILIMCDFLLKCAFAIGGAYFLPKVFGLVGDLFVNGGGTAEWREHEGALNDIKQNINDIRQIRRDRETNKDRQERKKREEAGQATQKNMAAGIAGLAGAASSVGNQFKNTVGDMAKTGSEISNIIENNPKNNLDSNNGVGNNVNQNSNNNSGNENHQENKVPGGEVVKNNVSNIIGGSNKGGK